MIKNNLKKYIGKTNKKILKQINISDKNTIQLIVNINEYLNI